MPDTADKRAPVAVFDLDVTLTRYDTFLPFVAGYSRFAGKSQTWALLRLLPLVFCFWRWRDPVWWKRRVLATVFGNEPQERVERWAARFARSLVARGTRPEGMATLRQHQAAGTRVVLASASIDIYVAPIARELGIKETLATPTRCDDAGRFRGLSGANCRDREKLARLRALPGMPDDGRGVAAYSDSHADLPLLGWAEFGVAVCPSRRLLRQVAGLELEIARW